MKAFCSFDSFAISGCQLNVTDDGAISFAPQLNKPDPQATSYIKIFMYFHQYVTGPNGYHVLQGKFKSKYMVSTVIRVAAVGNSGSDDTLFSQLVYINYERITKPPGVLERDSKYRWSGV